MAANKIYLVYIEIQGKLKPTPYCRFTTKKEVNNFMFNEESGFFEQLYSCMALATTKKKVDMRKWDNGIDLFVGTGNEPQLSVVVRHVDKNTKDEKSGPCGKVAVVNEKLSLFMMQYMKLEDFVAIFCPAA